MINSIDIREPIKWHKIRNHWPLYSGNSLWTITKNAECEPGYRELFGRVQRDNPDFTDQTIMDLWYTRDNRVASLRQGGLTPISVVVRIFLHSYAYRKARSTHLTATTLLSQQSLRWLRIREILKRVSHFLLSESQTLSSA